MKFQEILKYGKEKNASDIHFSIDKSLAYRINGDIKKIEDVIITEEKIKEIFDIILPENLKENLKKNKQIDFSYEDKNSGRFRVNIFKDKAGYSIVMRILDKKIKSIRELGLPDSIKELAISEGGLILITGSVGSGKTTTIASIIEYINAHENKTIITMEDPIEYIYEDKKCIINQREIGKDVENFKEGLKGALREDADVILVGEMRDLETISMALTAAETGQLVLATLHTNDAPSTINRIIDIFPENKQNQIALQLSMTLKGVISQKLIKNKENTDRILASEVMITNNAISNIIRQRDIHQIKNIIQTNREENMYLFERSLVNLVFEKKISVEEAQKHVNDISRFEKMLKYGDINVR